MTLEELADFYIETLTADSERRRFESPTGDPIPERTPRVGDLWSTRGEDPAELPFVVLITWAGDDFFRGILVLDEPLLSATDDVIVPSERSPLATPLALCVWRDVPLAASTLRSFLGSLADEDMEPVAMLLQQQLSGNFRRRPIGSSHLSSGEPVLLWTIESQSQPDARCQFPTGARIVRADDPRHRVRTELLRRSAYLEADAIAAIDDGEEILDEYAGGGEVLEWSPAEPLDMVLAAKDARVSAWPFRIALSRGGTAVGVLQLDLVLNAGVFAKNLSGERVLVRWSAGEKRRAFSLGPSEQARITSMQELDLALDSSRAAVVRSLRQHSFTVEVQS